MSLAASSLGEPVARQHDVEAVFPDGIIGKLFYLTALLGHCVLGRNDDESAFSDIIMSNVFTDGMIKTLYSHTARHLQCIP